MLADKVVQVQYLSRLFTVNTLQGHHRGALYTG